MKYDACLLTFLSNFFHKGNRKSGNSDGAVVLSEFRRFLNPAQVIDLAERRPSAALQWCVLVAPKPTRILAAGGDGTIAWILSTAYKMDLEVICKKYFIVLLKSIVKFLNEHKQC